MEFPDLGKHCSSSTCNILDFLPMKCDACSEIFCKDHIQYTTHQCPHAYQRDVQVPVCPLCNQPVPTKRGEAPDIRVGEHIDRDCQSDPAMAKRKVYTNKCNQKGCKHKEIIKIACAQCRKTFCLKHRFPQDHNCQGINGSSHQMSQAGAAAISRSQNNPKKVTQPSSKQPSSTSRPTINLPVRPMAARPVGLAANSVQGTLSEDEALAMALQKSLMEVNPNSQYDSDRQLAEALAASEKPPRNQRSSTSSCTVS